MGIDFHTRLARNDAIVFTELDDTIVMMDVEEGRYYELDPVGARVWALLESGPSVAAICDALLAEYEVTPETCREDILGFLEELKDLKVVLVQPEAGRKRRDHE